MSRYLETDENYERSSIIPEFICPITLEIMTDPVLCDDSYSYERSAIMSITNSLSPMTQQPINKSKLISNRALKNAIDKFLLDRKKNEQRCLKLFMENMNLCKFIDPKCELCKNNGEYSCDEAAYNGHLDCLKYAHLNGFQWDKDTCSLAAYNGHLDCLKYAHEKSYFFLKI